MTIAFFNEPNQANKYDVLFLKNVLFEAKIPIDDIEFLLKNYRQKNLIFYSLNERGNTDWQSQVLSLCYDLGKQTPSSTIKTFVEKINTKKKWSNDPQQIAFKSNFLKHCDNNTKLKFRYVTFDVSDFDVLRIYNSQGLGELSSVPPDLYLASF